MRLLGAPVDHRYVQMAVVVEVADDRRARCGLGGDRGGIRVVGRRRLQGPITTTQEDRDVPVGAVGDDDVELAIAIEIGERQGFGDGSTRRKIRAGPERAGASAEEYRDHVARRALMRHDEIGMSVAIEIADGHVGGERSAGVHDVRDTGAEAARPRAQEHRDVVAVSFVGGDDVEHAVVVEIREGYGGPLVGGDDRRARERDGLRGRGDERCDGRQAQQPNAQGRRPWHRRGVDPMGDGRGRALGIAGKLRVQDRHRGSAATEAA